MITVPDRVARDLRIKLDDAKAALDNGDREMADRLLTEVFAEQDRWVPRMQFTYPQRFAPYEPKDNGDGIR